VRNPSAQGRPTQKPPEAVPQFQTTFPPVLTRQGKAHASGGPGKGLAHDDTRLGLLPVGRRRITACGVPPGAPGTHPCDKFYLYGAVAPPTGARSFLDLPYLNRRAFPQWLDGCAAPLPESLHLLVLDHGAGHKAKAVRWPPNVLPLFLPPSSPELNPIERLWRDRKDQLADIAVKTMQELSDALCCIIPNYSHATLHALTSFAYFVQAVETAQKALYG
jgi:DDE superfamily endonuclease